jgi:hypothetical protein
VSGLLPRRNRFTAAPWSVDAFGLVEHYRTELAAAHAVRANPWQVSFMLELNGSQWRYGFCHHWWSLDFQPADKSKFCLSVTPADSGATRVTLLVADGAQLQADDDRCDIALALADIEMVLHDLGATTDMTDVSVGQKRVDVTFTEPVGLNDVADAAPRRRLGGGLAVPKDRRRRPRSAPTWRERA